MLAEASLAFAGRVPCFTRLAANLPGLARRHSYLFSLLSLKCSLPSSGDHCAFAHLDSLALRLHFDNEQVLGTAILADSEPPCRYLSPKIDRWAILVPLLACTLASQRKARHHLKLLATAQEARAGLVLLPF